MRFMDLREWLEVLEKESRLRRITAAVDWDREIGAIARRVLEKKGPALLFGSGAAETARASWLRQRPTLAP